MIAEYLNLDLRLFDHELLADGNERFRVQVAASPIDAQAQAETVNLSAGLRERLVLLDKRKLDFAATISLGQELAALLMPPGVLGFFHASLARLKPEQGLRLRLRCEALELDGIPWELVHVERDLDRAGAAAGLRGFIVLDTKISLVRREVCSQLLSPPRRKDPRCRLLTLMCEPADRLDPQRPLQVELELSQLREAIKGLDNWDLLPCEAGTREALTDLLTGGADIFHFAGHGEFERDAQGQAHAYLLLRRSDGRSDKWRADELATRLAYNGIQLAMLGACRSAQRDGSSAWAGIAPSLARAGVPAVIGMQFSVFDASALAFSRRFYFNWSRGYSLDEAMAVARGAIHDVEGDTGRDFATPVLYLREDGGLAALRLPPEPVVTPRPSPPATPQTDELAPLLDLLDEVYDYKCVHDKLHSIRNREFNVIVMRRDEFPGGSTLREFGSHARELRKSLQDLRRLAEQGRCQPALMADIVTEFGDALALLEQALLSHASEQLEDAIAAFETLLATHPVRVDTWMNSLSQQMELERMVAFVLGLPLSSQNTAAAVEELRQLGEQLRSHAMLHSQCQAIDNRLGVIRRSAEAARPREIRRQWRPLSASLDKLLPSWNAGDVEKLRQASSQLSAGVAANDERMVSEAFDQLCDDFDYGFYIIDSDFKQLCDRMKQQAEAQLPTRRSA